MTIPTIDASTKIWQDLMFSLAFVLAFIAAEDTIGFDTTLIVVDQRSLRVVGVVSSWWSEPPSHCWYLIYAGGADMCRHRSKIYESVY